MGKRKRKLMLMISLKQLMSLKNSIKSGQKVSYKLQNGVKK